MKKVTISKELKDILPNFSIGVISFNAQIRQLDNEYAHLISKIEESIRQQYELSDVLEIPFIKSARSAYKRLGKDPSRYRLAVESLHRRIVKGNSLYRINNLVDIGNVLSLESKRSVAVLDEDKIVGDIIIKIGKDENYEGINRGTLNIENIPIYCDDISPFGSPTSDTERTAIDQNTKNVLVFIISFDGMDKLQEDINCCIDLYIKYSQATNITQMII